MKYHQFKRPVVCFGEVLWDHLPAGKRPGGAPMNVAYHLHQLGINSQVISSIGNDQAGIALLDFLKEKGLPTAHIQVNDKYATSEVLATINKTNHEVTYEIIAPVAWDDIKWQPEIEVLLEEAQAFVFGSLSARSSETRKTLLKMLDHGAYHVFDVNLRSPHYSPEVINMLLQKSHMVKLNSSELLLIAQIYYPSCEKEPDALEVLFNRFNLAEILITKGSQGASYYTTSGRYDYPAYPVTVVDTVGSGDSFLAAFLAMKLANEPIEVALDYAVAMGSFITAKEGACPPYSKADLEKFIWEKKLKDQEKLAGNKTSV
jgi:fructokinase